MSRHSTPPEAKWDRVQSQRRKSAVEDGERFKSSLSMDGRGKFQQAYSILLEWLLNTFCDIAKHQRKAGTINLLFQNPIADR
jgi:hypothetical protein